MGWGASCAAMSERGQAADLFRIAPSWGGRGRAFLRFLAFCLLFCLEGSVLMLLIFAAMLLVIRKLPTRTAGADDAALDAIAAPTASR